MYNKTPVNNDFTTFYFFTNYFKVTLIAEQLFKIV
jgi:hypothetical protein